MDIGDSPSGLPASYARLVAEIKERIRAAQYAALRSVNRELIDLYWDIGRLILERQEGETWGRSVVQNLAKDLQAEFPGNSGFSTPNLYRMGQFYEAYYGSPIFSSLVREISWTKNLAILERCKDVVERKVLPASNEGLRLVEERPDSSDRKSDIPEDASELQCLIAIRPEVPNTGADDRYLLSIRRRALVHACPGWGLSPGFLLKLP